MSNRRLIFVNRVYRPSPQATAQLLTDLAEGLVPRLPDWSIHVIATGETSATENGVTIHRTGPSTLPGGLVTRALSHRRFIQAARARLSTLMRPGDFVVPMTDPPLLATAVARDAAARGARIVPWIQDIYPEIVTTHFGPLAGFFFAPFKASRDSAWLAAATCVTLGPDMARTVANRGVPADRIAILPNWAPPELHTPARPDAIAACRTRWGVADQFVVAYSGNLGRVHEFETIVRAADCLRDHANIVFLFIGQGPRFNEVRSAARDRGLTNLRFLPPEPRENLPVSLAAADVQLVTLRSRYAALVYPSKLAGVLAAGRPVLFVGPPDGDIGQLLARETCGAAVPPGDGPGLANTLSRWQRDAGACHRLGAAARSAYERHFTAEAGLAGWEALLRRLSAGPA